MKFPKWVLKAPKKLQASARLRYLCYRLAIEVTPKASVRALCEQTSIDHSTVATYIRRGEFSNALAAKWEEQFGPHLAQASWFTDPLNIPLTTK